jgi:creatinine amidohydrolase/Fe(II)-dependent formamide hydrolase-like protein
VILPLGAIEEHGPHLPLLVDWLGAEELARVIAPYLQRAGWRPVLAPSLPYGVSPLAEEWSGTVSLSIPTLRRVVGEIIRGLARHGFRRFVLANYQADPGHLRAMALIKRDAERRRRVQVLFAGFAPGQSAAMVNPRVTALLRSPQPEREWHSGELETAMMLAVQPKLVRRAVARKLPPAWVDVKRALASGPTTFKRMNPRGRGYFGWPAAARAQTGRAALRLRARLISRELISALGSWRPDRSCRPGRS